LSIDNRVIGERIAFERRKLDKSQFVLAEEADLSPQHLSCLERGEKQLSLNSLFRIASALNVTPGFLVDPPIICAAAMQLSELSDLLCDCNSFEYSLIVAAAVGSAERVKQILRA